MKKMAIIITLVMLVGMFCGCKTTEKRHTGHLMTVEKKSNVWLLEREDNVQIIKK